MKPSCSVAWLACGLAAAGLSLLLADNLPAQETPPAVKVIQPHARDLVRELRTPATVAAYETAEIYAKTSGYLKTILVDIGDTVGKGDVLAVIDVPEMLQEKRAAEAVLQARKTDVLAASARIAEAAAKGQALHSEQARFQAELELQQITAQRQRELHAGNAISQHQLDQAESALKVAQANLAINQAEIASAEAMYQTAQAGLAVAESQVSIAEAQLAHIQTLIEYAELRAPFDGVITVRNADTGDFVRSAVEGDGQPLLVTARVDKLRIRINVPEPDVPFVHAGQTPVDLVFAAFPDRDYRLPVARTSRALDPNTRTMRAEVHLNNPQGDLMPGMYVSATVRLIARAAALTVPSGTVHSDGDGQFVYVCLQDTVRRQPVRIGLDDGVWAEVIEGCDLSTLVIESMQGTVSSGDRVRPVLDAAERL